jgi:transaldolase
LNVLKEELPLWKPRILEIIHENPTWSEVEITWKIFEEIGVKGSKTLLPVFERLQGKKGRLSIQTNPANYRNPGELTRQAVHFDSLAPNIQVKIPVTKAGIQAIEETTYQGVNINATVCFTVPQAVAVAEAVERGLQRRKAEGKPTDSMTPVCTIMIGRTDDWIKVVAKKEKITVTPGDLEWAGIACMKKAYQIYQSRGFQTRLLAAAFRNHMHWSELIGGDLILTIPYEWQLLYNSSDIEVKERIDNPVDEKIINNLYSHFEEFRKAFDEDGLKIDDFDLYGATARTLRGFINSYHDLQSVIRDFMIPNPDN